MSSSHLYYIFTALIYIGMGVTVTAYAPYLQSVGLSLGEIGLVNTVFWTVLILSELPTGMLADGRSRAWSLKLGGVFYSAGALSYVFANSFWSAAFAEGLIGIGGAFISGAGTAWVADALHREGRSDELRQVYATESLIKSVLLLLGGFVGASIGLINYRFIWVPLVITSLMATVVAHRFMNGRGEALEYVGELEAFRRAWRQLYTSRSLMWLIASLIVFGAVISFNHYWAIYFTVQVGQFNVAYLWVVMYLGLVGAAQLVRRLTIPLGSESSLIVLAVFLSGLGLGLIVLAPGLWFSIPAVVIHEFGRGLFQPLTDSFVQSRVHTSYRATFGSLQSFLGRMGFAIVPLVVYLTIQGKPDTPETILYVWGGCAIFLIVGSVVLWMTKPRT
jgi:MFS transporter, DHA3 family, tetracycline resistance protein